jgi:hypothetical protein
MTCFGLSPLLYSLVATHLFSEPESGLEVIPFLRFLAIWTAVVHLFGAVTLRVPVYSPTPALTPPPEEVEEGTSSGTVTPYPDERQPLLPNKPTPQPEEDSYVAPEENETAMQLFRDPDFWALFGTVLLVLGAVSTLFIAVKDYTDGLLLFSLRWSCRILAQSSSRYLPTAILTPMQQQTQ